MQVLVLGVGDAFTRRHFGSSALIAAPEGYVLIDCPDPIHRVLREATSRAGWDVDVTMIDDILLTHLHGDHCNGLESLAYYRRLLRLEDPPHTRPRLHVSAPVADRLWERLAPAMDGPIGDATASTLADYFDLRVLEPERVAQVAGLQVDCRFTGHTVPTIGLRIRDGSGSLGWSSDTPFEAAHVAWLAEADLIVHESNLGVAHTSIDALNELPADVRGRMRLIHLPDDFDDRATDIAILEEGDVLEPSTVPSG